MMSTFHPWCPALDPLRPAARFRPEVGTVRDRDAAIKAKWDPCRHPDIPGHAADDAPPRGLMTEKIAAVGAHRWRSGAERVKIR
jgi:hypothetical protein